MAAAYIGVCHKSGVVKTTTRRNFGEMPWTGKPPKTISINTEAANSLIFSPNDHLSNTPMSPSSHFTPPLEQAQADRETDVHSQHAIRQYTIHRSLEAGGISTGEQRNRGAHSCFVSPYLIVQTLTVDFLVLGGPMHLQKRVRVRTLPIRSCIQPSKKKP